MIQDTPGNAFEPGTTVLVYAVANTGYYFSHWASDYGAFREITLSASCPAAVRRIRKFWKVLRIWSRWS